MFFFFISVFTISQSASTVCYYTTLKQERVFEVSQERFSTLWNYTTLKLQICNQPVSLSFSTLWNYTTLKLLRSRPRFPTCFSTLWNYTTLKLSWLAKVTGVSFSTLWNYTTLKQSKTNWNCLWVSVPYEITLLSNFSALDSDKDEFQYLMKLHHSQTHMGY